VLFLLILANLDLLPLEPATIFIDARVPAKPAITASSLSTTSAMEDQGVPVVSDAAKRIMASRCIFTRTETL
jgi:hypothetical protein